MCDILTEQLQHYTVLWRETSALYEEWAKRHALSYYELLVILSIMNPDGPCLQKDICTHWQLPKQTAGQGHSANRHRPVIYGSNRFRPAGS